MKDKRGTQNTFLKINHTSIDFTKIFEEFDPLYFWIYRAKIFKPFISTYHLSVMV